MAPSLLEVLPPRLPTLPEFPLPDGLIPSELPSPAAPLERLGAEATLEAGRLELRRDAQQLHASDGVVLRAGRRLLTAPAATLDLATGRLSIDGEFRLEGPEGAIRGEKADLQLEPLSGVVLHGAIDAASGLRLTGARLERTPEGTWRLKDATLTACDCEPSTAWREPSALTRFLARPSWALQARELELCPDEARDRVTVEGAHEITRSLPDDSAGLMQREPCPSRGGRVSFRAATVRIKGIPILYLPRGTFPIERGRRTGLLPPELWRGDDGMGVRLPFLWLPGDSTDLSFALTFNQRRGFMPDLRLRVSPSPDVVSSFGATWLYDWSEDWQMTGASPHRWALQWRHRGPERRPVRLVADVREVSDAWYLRDLGRDLELRATGFLPSAARVELGAGRLEASVGFARFRELASVDPAAGEGAGSPYVGGAHLPELLASWRSLTLAGPWGTLQARAYGGSFYEDTMTSGGWSESWWSGSGGDGRLFASIRPELSLGRALGRVAMIEGSLGYAGIAAVAAAGGADYDARPAIRAVDDANYGALPAKRAVDSADYGALSGAGAVDDADYGALPAARTVNEANYGALSGVRASEGTDYGAAQAAGTSTAQRVSARLAVSTAFARTWERPEHAVSAVQHRIEPSLQWSHDLWSRQDASFIAPLGDPWHDAAPGAWHTLTGVLTQRLLIRRGLEGGRLPEELARFRLAQGFRPGEAQPWTDLGAELELQRPLSMRASVLIDPRTGRMPWATLHAGWEGEVAGFGLGYGWLDPERPGVLPGGLETQAPFAAQELQLEARTMLAPLVPPALDLHHRLNGWGLEARSRVSLVDGFDPTAAQLALRYESPCRCFSARLFLTWEKDREIPGVGAQLTPTPLNFTAMPGGVP